MVTIKNRSELESKTLGKNQLYLRKVGLNCLVKAIEAVKPENLVSKSVKIKNDNLIIDQDAYNLNNIRRVYIIGGGKASASMLVSIENIFQEYRKIGYEGIINVPEGLEIENIPLTNKVMLNFATHPIPNESGLDGVKKMMDIINKASQDDLIICLISGGGSALLPLPREGISLEDLKKLNSLLLASGASIHEINIIRKHISRFKGGNLAKAVYNSSKALLISLIISDVVGDKLESIASGPTAPDISTFNDAVKILKKYNLYEKIPISIKTTLEKGLIDKDFETPKPNDVYFKYTHNYLVGNVNFAVKAAETFLKAEEFYPLYFSKRVSGEAREFGENLYEIIISEIEEITNEKKNNLKLALIGSGELTVTLKGDGIGGRNQEMLLSFLQSIKNKKINCDFIVISVNLDGIEGNSKAMGAMVDNYILKQVIEKKYNPEEYLSMNDSNTFFNLVGSEIITGPTGCNVNDFLLILLTF
ncbi:MAG: glycerate kinase [Promethearchaeota archaeon]